MVRRSPAETILHGSDPDEILRACDRLTSREFRGLDSVVAAALAGKSSAIGEYVSVSRRLIHRLLAVVYESQPDTEFAVDWRRSQKGFFEHFLELGVLDAPFSPWVGRYGPGRGSALFFISRLRAAFPRSSPLPVPKSDAVFPPLEVSPDEFTRFVRKASDLLPIWSDSVPALDRVRRLFCLNNSELGRLFSASRQAATAWLENGAPSGRLPKLNTVVKIADILEMKLKPGRLPAVVRSKALAYGDRNMLERIAADEHEGLLDDVRATFDWAATA